MTVYDGKMTFQYFNLIKRKLLDIIFPQKRLVEELESISAKDFLEKVPRASIKTTKDESLVAFLSYRNPLMRQAIWEIKYANNKGVFRLLGKALAILLSEYLVEHGIERSEVIIIPLPLSAKRHRERGYNQTEKLAEMIVGQSEEHFCKIEAGMLKKTRHTISQTKMNNRNKRLENIKGSIQCNIENGNLEKLKEKTVIILDDVTTTGATLREAAGALKASGARRIICVALAH